MPRDFRVYLDDVIEAVRKIDQYLNGYDFEKFSADSRTVDAVVRNLEIVGEAVKKLPEDVKSKYPAIEWKKIAGLRDILNTNISALIKRLFGILPRTNFLFCLSKFAKSWKINSHANPGVRKQPLHGLKKDRLGRCASSASRFA